MLCSSHSLSTLTLDLGNFISYLLLLNRLLHVCSFNYHTFIGSYQESVVSSVWLQWRCSQELALHLRAKLGMGSFPSSFRLLAELFSLWVKQWGTWLLAGLFLWVTEILKTSCSSQLHGFPTDSSWYVCLLLHYHQESGGN